MQFFRAEIDGRLVALVRLDDDGHAFRITRNRPGWERVPDLDRLARDLPADRLFWDPVDEATARSSAAEMRASVE